MKLHRLSFAALGPFAAHEVIDLDEVAAGGLFLLEGPTGSGKSTILDAITFALYGGVAGSAASKDRLHSDFATDVEPFAELDFSIGGRMFRIRRTPTYEKLKKNGSGITTVNSKVWLWELSPGIDGLTDDLISNRVSEAGAEILRLLGGLSLEQFRQVVILPQGEFATFLRADADQRRDVLQRLFATDHYQDMEDLAASQRRSAEREKDEAAQQLRDAVVAFVQALGPDSAATFDIDEFLALDAESQQANVQDIRAVIEAGHQAATRHEQDLREQADSGEQEFRSITAQHQQADRRIELEVEYDRLRAAAAEIAELVGMRDRAIQVQALAPLFEQRTDVERNLARSFDAAQQYQNSVGAHQTSGLSSDPTVDEVAAFSAQMRSVVSELAPALTLEQAWDAQQTELAVLTETTTRSRNQLEIHQRDLEVLPVQLSTLHKRRDELVELTLRLPDLERNLAELERKVEAWSRLTLVEAAVQERDDQRRRAIDAAQAARDQLQAATEQRLAGMAAELAQDLRDNVPCVVCGSTTHPNPAVSSEPIISDQQLNDLRERAELTGKARQDAETALMSAIADRDLCRFQAGDNDPRPERDQGASDLARAHTAVTELELVVNEIALTQAAIDQAQEARANAQVDLAKTQQLLDQLTVDVEANLVAIEAARGEFTSVAERSAFFVSQSMAADSWAQALGELLFTREQLVDLDVRISRAAHSNVEQSQSLPLARLLLYPLSLRLKLRPLLTLRASDLQRLRLRLLPALPNSNEGDLLHLRGSFCWG